MKFGLTLGLKIKFGLKTEKKKKKKKTENNTKLPLDPLTPRNFNTL